MREADKARQTQETWRHRETVKQIDGETDTETDGKQQTLLG